MKEVFRSFQKELLQTQQICKYTLREIDLCDAEAQEEAMDRYQRNSALLKELFDSRGLTELVASEERQLAEARTQYEEVQGRWTHSPSTAGVNGAASDLRESLWLIRSLRSLNEKAGSAASMQELKAAVREFEEIAGPCGPQGILQGLSPQGGEHKNGDGNELGRTAAPAEMGSLLHTPAQLLEDLQECRAAEGMGPAVLPARPLLPDPSPSPSLLGKRCMRNHGPSEPSGSGENAWPQPVAPRDPRLSACAVAEEERQPEQPALRRLCRKLELPVGEKPPAHYYPIRL